MRQHRTNLPFIYQTVTPAGPFPGSIPTSFLRHAQHEPIHGTSPSIWNPTHPGPITEKRADEHEHTLPYSVPLSIRPHAALDNVARPFGHVISSKEGPLPSLSIRCALLPFSHKRVSTVSARDNSTLLSSPQTNKRRLHFGESAVAQHVSPNSADASSHCRGQDSSALSCAQRKCPRLTSRRAHLAPRLASARNHVRLRLGSDFFNTRLKCQRRLQKQHSENVTHAQKNPKIIRPIRLKQSGLTDHHQLNPSSSSLAIEILNGLGKIICPFACAMLHSYHPEIVPQTLLGSSNHEMCRRSNTACKKARKPNFLLVTDDLSFQPKLPRPTLRSGGMLPQLTHVTSTRANSVPSSTIKNIQLLLYFLRLPINRVETPETCQKGTTPSRIFLNPDTPTAKLPCQLNSPVSAIHHRRPTVTSPGPTQPNPKRKPGFGIQPDRPPHPANASCATHPTPLASTPS